MDLKNPLVQDDVATDRSFEGFEDELPDSKSSEVDFNPLSLPRAILPPIKRRGHVTLDLCTPSGKLERWTVPKSFSKLAYHDARKSRWGDLWALGAKTRVPRSPRLGRATDEGGKVKGIRDGRMGKGGKKAKKVQNFDMVVGKHGFEAFELPKSEQRKLPPMKRTKGGRIYKKRPPISEEDLG